MAPDRISFAPITPNNLGTVRKLNSVLFPIKYSEAYYKNIQLPEVEELCKLSASRLSRTILYISDAVPKFT
jgi:hypothetical protein